MSDSNVSKWETAGNIVAFGGAHVLAPIAVGSGGTLLVRYLANCEQIVHVPWMAGMSGLALVTNAGFQYLGRWSTKQLHAQLDAQLAAQQGGARSR